jgi:DNA polymerase-3 subunit beta
MEVLVPHQDLSRALELIGKVSSKNITLPILQCVLVKADKETVTLEATNLELSISIPLTAQVTEEGVVAVPTQTLLQSIQFISQKEITLRTEEQVLQLETNTSNTSIKTYPAEDFPTIHKVTGEEMSINSNQFAHGIKSVAFAASVTSIKPELGSVFVQQKKEHSLTFVATDSFRLMEKTVSQKGVVLDQSFMVPHKNALELARVCEVLGGEARLVVTENQCVITFPNGVYIASRLITGSFPDYIQIIPKEFVSHVVALKDDLLRSFKKTNIFLNKFRQVSLTITTNGLTVASHNNEVGHTTDSIRAEVDGDELTLNFNQQYMLDPLQYINDDAVKLSFAGIGRAVIMEGANDKSLRYLVMPMNK